VKARKIERIRHSVHREAGSGLAWLQPWPRLGRPLSLLMPLAGLGFFALALWALHHSLEAHRYRDLLDALRRLPGERLAASLAITVAAYGSLIGYDLLAMRFVGRPTAWRDVAAPAMLSGALGNNLGNTLLTGGAMRFWLYTSIGLSAAQIARVVLFCSLGFWLGYLFLAGSLFAFVPFDVPSSLHLGITTTRPLGAVLLALLVGWLALCVRRRPLGSGTWRMELPTPGLTLGQIAVACCDLSLMAMALYVLLPSGVRPGFAAFLPLFLVALVAGTASQVPGGLGVFEAVMLLLLSPRIDARDLAAALLAFRGIYLVLPLLVAVIHVGAQGALRTRPAWLAWLVGGGRSWAALAPPILAAMAFLSGAILLASGALPAAVGRLAAVQRILSLPVVEVSSFLASLVGAALLVVARGLQRRLEAAWLLAVALLGSGAILSLAKGWDFEEASILGGALLVLLPLRRHFYRTSSLLGAPFTPAWIGSCVIVVAGSAWLTLFAYRDDIWAAQSWWEFAWQSEAPRSLRATVGAIGLFVLLALHRLIRPPRTAPPAATGTEIERAQPLVERSVWTYANLVYRGDKALLFSEAGDAFLMYGRMGRSWIAMGDPIGAEPGVREVAWRFRDLCDQADGWCVFFEVRPERREFYAELGLTMTPLGEEARVDMSGFSLDTSSHRMLRQARAKLLRGGYRFEIVPREAVAAILPALARISRSWLQRKATHEKGFSNASFDDRYLSRFPVAVVRHGGDILAFANLWLGADREELSVDLMRHSPDAPNGAMDFLFCELLSWGRSEGYRWFNFGMAPLAGLETAAEADLWRQIGGFIYRHAEHFYNFEGLRRYKAKFDPVWTPRYLASPGGLALAPVLLDVTALIAGGYSAIVSKQGPSSGMRP
jgi:phosphatidylglycerol lysyltransferase